MVSNYETPSTTGIALDRGIAGRAGGGTPDVNIGVASVTPTDRVRWGPVIAGLFTALSTLVVLSVLGAAVAGSTFDPGDQARTYGIGTGVWAAVSMLIAFGLGGWLAAKSAAVRGHHNGVLNGAMVWIVAIPLMLWMISAAVGTAARTASGLAQTGAQVAGAVGQAAENDAMPASAQQQADQAAEQASQAVQQASQSVQSGRASQQAKQTAQQAASPQNQERAADAVAWGAWSTLAALLVSLAAAAAGGYAGARTSDRDHGRRGDHAVATPA